ncbi:hypothetical protein B0I31_10550 [Saccharothrix carnea]|uniref:DUF3800 domain-containing protein n=1 Tax=Saccharothrix carnea TaxID=1280637 RepID=A0A2P8I9E7_SACCR|nr:hypothetical protein [Saccharothrix carnea]PSL55093.1 hypothetical protein B0I31_10550 [Saccharothrix carnea]
MSVHAFVDESQRNHQYFLAAAVVAPAELRPLRTLLRGLLLPGQRELHFKKETQQRRRLILARLAEGGARVRIYQRAFSRDAEAARQDCLARLTADMLDLDVNRLVLDTREDRDILDDRTMRTSLGKYPRASQLAYEHLLSTSEPLLWIPDAVAWSHGAGGDWARRAMGTVVRVVKLDHEP